LFFITLTVLCHYEISICSNLHSVMIQEMGGLAKIDQLMSDLPELLARNREILSEVDIFHFLQL
jgi:hypothetical protein